MGSIDLFPLAADLARAEGAKTIGAAAVKAIALRSIKNRAQDVCCCSAYSFPHRAGSGWCPGQNVDTQTLDDINREELALFDRAEALAMNSGAW